MDSLNINAPQKGTRTCSVPSCENRIEQEDGNKLSFFRFPRDPERCLRWILLCGRQDLLSKDADHLHNKYKICGEHFESRMFANPTLRNRLTFKAHPTLFKKNVHNDLTYFSKGEDDEYDMKNVILLQIKQEPELAMHPPVVEDAQNLSSSAIQKAPIKLTFKTKSDNSFEIIKSPTTTDFPGDNDSAAQGHFESESNLEEITTADLALFAGEHGDGGMGDDSELSSGDGQANHLNGLDDVANTMFSAGFDCDASRRGDGGSYLNMSPSQTMSNNSQPHISNNETLNMNDIPGAEPTPPPESPSPTTEHPKIRIKTTGLLKNPLTITEITDDNPNGEYRPSSNELIEQTNTNHNHHPGNYWNSSLLEDPLKLPDSDNILTNFLNNTDHVSDNEFISLDRLDDRNCTALQVYNPSNSIISTEDSLAGLPMQQLAEQVSRLQHTGGSNTMHQQNVLINIQQFPQAPSQQSSNYQHPSMYPPHPNMASQPPPPPMYQHQPYQYQPNPMYYPPAPNYAPAPHMPPPPPQMQQPPSQQMPPPPQQGMPPPPQQGMAPPPQQGMPPPPPQQPPYRQPMPPRSGACPPPRQYPPRAPAPRQPNFQPRQRAPMIRTRGGIMGPSVRGPRPRMPHTNSINQTQNVNNNHAQQKVIKRNSDHMQDIQNKKKRMDVLVPDPNDDADCQVIAVQPKNTDGGLPQIQSIHGGTAEPSDNIMHLSDSITLSVRNPPPKQESPKKSDAKVVANILATRGITVTATPKPKQSLSKESSPPPSVAINLNSAVSIIPTAKANSPTPASKQNNPKLPTVDLTDDSEPVCSTPIQQPANSPQKSNPGALPFRCDLCPAQYPTNQGLSKHRQSYHKTGAPCEIGIPLIDFKQPGIVQKLTSLGIYNFIPLPNSTPNGNFALPVVSVNVAKNSSVCNLSALGASSILTLGPVRSLPKPQVNNSHNNVPAPKH